MKSVSIPVTILLVLALGAAAAPEEADAGPGSGDTESELRAVELAFAQTMADRDHDAFAGFLAEETVFFGPMGPMRGKQVVATAWKLFFAGPTAPFSWEPEDVVVLESGKLGLTSGPVRDPEGNRVGTFNSVWRREAGGAWKVVFDRGCPPCQCP